MANTELREDLKEWVNKNEFFDEEYGYHNNAERWGVESYKVKDKLLELQAEIERLQGESKWEDVSRVGQVQTGDIVKAFGKESKFDLIGEVEVIDEGRGTEEIIFKNSGNKYFITDMLLFGSSWARSAVFIKQPKTLKDNNNA